MTSHPDFDIIIVGAGGPGIAAARQARSQGRSVLLLEARDRPGGRARTVHAPGGTGALR
jgi:monoamine oxidase